MTRLLERDLEAGLRGEDAVAEVLTSAWGCEFRASPLRSVYDFELVRANRTRAIVEVKTRTFEATKYADTYLPLEKWYRLLDISRALEVKGIFIANFTDEIRGIEVGRIDARRHEVCGRTDRPNMPHDWSTKILVPVEEMKALWTWDRQVAA